MLDDIKNGLIALGVTVKELQTERHGVWDLHWSPLGAKPGFGGGRGRPGLTKLIVYQPGGGDLFVTPLLLL